MNRIVVGLGIHVACFWAPVSTTRAEFHTSPWFGEQVYEAWIEAGVRAIVISPPAINPALPTRLIIYATPNGNTIEQTLGCRKTEGLDWHFDIQHIAAQVRCIRDRLTKVNVVLACVEAEGLSWPAWRKKHPDNAVLMARVIGKLKTLIGQPVTITLTGHSGGGSFITSVVNAFDAIPADIDLIAHLDSNYSYSDSEIHGDKLLAWLRSNEKARLVVIAYDDRNIMLDDKPVVGPDGGTFRASQRMIGRLRQDIGLAESTAGDFVNHVGLDGRVRFHIHQNSANKILHTVLVGEMNGLIHAITEGAPTGPRSYEKWVQPAPGFPPRPKDAIGGAAFVNRIRDLTPAERDAAIAAELLRGNFPDSLRAFVTVAARHTDAGGRHHTASYEVMPDYLAVGSDEDFVRMPMTPMTAQRIADSFDCSLPTRKIVNDIYKSAGVQLEPKPLTEARESAATFQHHNELIERQRTGRSLIGIIAGIKKDIVVTNRLEEKPRRVAIYGWHKLDGQPIQPLNVNHVNTYVDYSHGVRLIKRTISVDGKPMDIRHVMYSRDLCGLLSDEGPIVRPSY